MREGVPETEHRDGRARPAPWSGRPLPRTGRRAAAGARRGTRSRRAEAASRGRPDGSRRRRATASAGRGGRRGRSRGRTSPSRGACGPAERRAQRRAQRPTAWATRSSDGLGQANQSGTSAATTGSKWAPSREICSPWRSVTSRNRPCAVDQTAWVRLPTSNRPVSKARCWSTASADIPAAKAPTAPQRRSRGRIIGLRLLARWRVASGAPRADSLARAS